MPPDCVRAEAPLKVTIAGEHAVVYGYPALAAAIDRRVYIKICRRPWKGVVITSRGASIVGDLSLRCSGGECRGEVGAEHMERLFSYAVKAVEISSKELGDLGGLEIEISSSAPVGAGLGTSAAISAGIVAGYAMLSGASLGQREVASIARRVEIAVQGAASPMDTGVVSLGGVLLIRPSEGDPFKRVTPGTSLEILVAVTPKKRGTRETVAMVRSLYSRRQRVVENLLKAIGEISEEASKAVEEGDIGSLGELMNMNHSILRALGVVDMESEHIAEAMRSSGLDGVKISGGGWGGAVIGVSRDRRRLEVALETLSRYGVAAFIAPVEHEGVRCAWASEG